MKEGINLDLITHEALCDSVDCEGSRYGGSRDSKANVGSEKEQEKCAKKGLCKQSGEVERAEIVRKKERQYVPGWKTASSKMPDVALPRMRAPSGAAVALEEGEVARTSEDIERALYLLGTFCLTFCLLRSHVFNKLGRLRAEGTQK